MRKNQEIIDISNYKREINYQNDEIRTMTQATKTLTSLLDVEREINRRLERECKEIKHEYDKCTSQEKYNKSKISELNDYINENYNKINTYDKIVKQISDKND